MAAMRQAAQNSRLFRCFSGARCYEANQRRYLFVISKWVAENTLP
jgi:hypothetical protein